MLRTHDVVVAEGTFRVVLTPKRRVIAILDAPHTMLGPLHVALEVDRSRHLPPNISPRVLTDPSFATAGIFDDIGHAVSKAGEGAFNAVSHVATTAARPAFDILKHATGEAAHLIAHAPLLPDAARRQLEAGARTIMRARLGDLTAKQFIKTITSAANAGVQAARHVGDALLEANKLVAKTIDVPTMLASHIPGIGGIVKSISPLQKYQSMIGAIQRGDVRALTNMAREDLGLAQGVISMIPGVGTGVSAAIGAGLAALQGGSPLEIAVRAAYGAIPIPLGLRSITDGVVDSVLALASNPHNLTDVAIQIARDRAPAGIPRDLFDTLVQLVVHRVPIQKAGASLVDHYVRQYAPAFSAAKLDPAALFAYAPPATPHVNGVSPRMIQPLHVFGS